jgi:hypothetical protein
MSASKTVDEIVTAIKELDDGDRGSLLLQLAKIDELMEDLEDLMDLIRSETESGRPFDEFVRELESKRGDA